MTPFIGASYSQIWTGEAKESGGGDFNYTISDATAYTTVAFIGGEFSVPVALAGEDGMAVVGFARVGYDFFADDNAAHSVTATSPTPTAARGTTGWSGCPRTWTARGC